VVTDPEDARGQQDEFRTAQPDSEEAAVERPPASDLHDAPPAAALLASEVPRVADGEVHQLDRRYVTLRRQTGVLGWVISTAVLYAGLMVLLAALRAGDRTETVLRVAFWALTLIRGWLAFAWPAISYCHASYRVDQSGVESRRGVITRTIVNVPRSRVQHTDVTQGPLERRHGLATLSIHTAGRQHELVTIFGLPHAQAIAIRDFLLPRENADAV
jgi:membrane protein YdbS with pleckstrin-like domain